jgi:hypothetical protein
LAKFDTQNQIAVETQGITNYRAYCYANLNQAYMRFLTVWRAYANPRTQNTLQRLFGF